jgi:paired amphipathic helix protein Sin3a
MRQREVHLQISRLFKDAPDLRSDFKIFMPEKSQSMFEEMDDMVLDGPSERRSGRIGTPSLDKTVNARRGKDKGDVPPPTVPQKRKRKVDSEKGKEVLSNNGKVAAAASRVSWRYTCVCCAELTWMWQVEKDKATAPSR